MREAPAPPPPAHPTFAEAAKVWARIGLLSFGGPAGQIALMHRELVERRGWISEPRFLHALNFCMLLPGPEAQQLATYVGWLLHGTRGGVVAGLLFVLPGFVVILALSAAYALYGQSPLLAGLFFGLKCAVLAIVAEAAVRIGRRALTAAPQRIAAAAAFLALFLFAVPFPAVVLAAGLAGLALAWRRPVGLASPAAEADHLAEAGGREARGGRRAVGVLALWLALWALPLAPVLAVWGAQGGFVALFGFFSQMAVVTFGGAYAVLAYVAQQAVDHYGWLKPGEMLDGLALAETTPGPLVLVLVFVGFMAGFRSALGLDPLAGAMLGAFLAAWATFAPCFLWIFLGAPFVERLRANKALAGALSLITAAVVGVIVNLALWFALHVLFARVRTLELGPLALAWPEAASLDWRAAGLATLAALMLMRFKRGVPETLGLCAMLGVALEHFSQG